MKKPETSAAIHKLGLPLSELTEEILPVFQRKLRLTQTRTVMRDLNPTGHINSFFIEKLHNHGILILSANKDLTVHGNSTIQSNFALYNSQEKIITEAMMLGVHLNDCLYEITHDDPSDPFFKYVQNVEKHEGLNLSFTFHGDVWGIMKDNIQTVTDIAVMISSNCDTNEQAMSALQKITNQSGKNKNKETYLEVFSNMPNGFWGRIVRDPHIPAILIPGTIDVDPKFISALQKIRVEINATSDHYHGGCPARHTVYYDDMGVPYPFEKSAVTQLMNFFLNNLADRMSA